jgi:solute carrier family 25 folate transporter 32
MIASVATYPHEVLRTRLQIQKYARETSSSTTLSQSFSAASNSSHPSQLPHRPSFTPSMISPSLRPAPATLPPYEGIGMTFKKILREEGYRGFYRGMGVNLLRTVPSSAMTILTFVFFFSFFFPPGDPIGY